MEFSLSTEQRELKEATVAFARGKLNQDLAKRETHLFELSGDLIGEHAMTGPGSGSDAFGTRTRAELRESSGCGPNAPGHARVSAGRMAKSAGTLPVAPCRRRAFPRAGHAFCEPGW